MSRQNPRKLDWLAIKIDYLSGIESLRAIFRKYKLAPDAHKMKHTKGWIVERKKLHQQIINRTKNKIVSTNVKKWEKQWKLLGKVEDECKRVLDSCEKGQLISPDNLNKLANAINKTLISKRLIFGESTENVKSLHLMLVEGLEKIKNDNPRRTEEQNMASTEHIQNQGQEEEVDKM